MARYKLPIKSGVGADDVGLVGVISALHSTLNFLRQDARRASLVKTVECSLW